MTACAIITALALLAALCWMLRARRLAAGLRSVSKELDVANAAGAMVMHERERAERGWGRAINRSIGHSELLTKPERERIADACAAVASYAARVMPRETSTSIAQWQNDTFGPATTDPARVERTRVLITQAFDAVRYADLSVARPNLSRAVRAGEELAELVELLVANDSDPHAGTEVADVQIVLAGIPAALGQEQARLVDAKMVENRARTWATTGDGHGQHVECGQLSEFFDGEIDDARATAFRSHLADCTRCQSEVHDAVQVERLVGAKS